MTKTIIYIITAFVIGGLSVSSLQAQSLQKEITVDREVVLTHRDANRMLITPQISLPEMSRSSLGYAFYSGASDLTSDVAILPPPGYKDAIDVDSARGYISVGYFPLKKIDLSAGYKIIDNERTRLNAFMQVNNNSYNSLSTMDWKYWRGEFTTRNTTYTLGGSARHLLKSGELLNFALDYTYANYRFPCNERLTQDVNRFNLLAGYNANNSDYRAVGSINYSYFGYRCPWNSLYIFDNRWIGFYGKGKGIPARENTLSASVSYFLKNENVELGGTVTADVIHDNTDRTTSRESGNQIYGNGNSRTHGTVRLKPQINCKSENASAEIGIEVDINLRQGTRLRFAPNISASWIPFDIIRMDLTAKGGVVQNTISSLYDLTPYQTFLAVYNNSYIPIDGKMTLTLGPKYGAWCQGWIGYSIADNWLMPYGYRWIYEKVKGYRAGIAFGYNWRNFAELSLSYEYSPSGYEKGYYLNRDRASKVGTAKLKITPIKPLDINASFFARGGRQEIEVVIPYGDISNLYRKNNPLLRVLDLSLGASYRYNPNLSFWIKGENILNKCWILLGNVTVQGATGWVGVSYKY